MPLGPIEMLVVKFPGNQFTGEIMPALVELVDNGIVRIVDLLFLVKDADGRVALFELSDLEPDVFGIFAPLVTDITPMLNEDDAYQLANLLENNSSAGLVLFENVWATRFANAVRNARGEVVLNERIPRAVIEELMAETA
ncbi:MAG: DUF6325 family protein [Thermomicrobiales bacterium]